MGRGVGCGPTAIPLPLPQGEGDLAPTSRARSVPDHKLKPLIGLVDTPPMREDLRRLVDWIAAYTLSPPGEVMAMALRVNRAAPGPATGWRRPSRCRRTRA